MRVLISGFEPFGAHKLNPTLLLINELNAGKIRFPSSMTVDSIILPVTFENAYTTLKERINLFNPDVVMSFGLASGRSEINLETLAVNTIHADIKDNNGIQPRDVSISESGPDHFQSTLPLFGLEGALKKDNIPVKFSNSAGKYVCNYLFYKLMEDNQDSGRLCGFIHVPLLPEQATTEPSMSLEDLKKALSVMLEYINY